MQFSLEKRPKKENIFIQPIIPVDGLCYKMGYNRFIISTKIFFIYLEMFKTAESEMRKKEWVPMGIPPTLAKAVSFSYA